MTKAKIGVQAMMLREEFEKIGPYETLKKISDLGFNAVEISQIPMTPENVQEIKRATKDFGMEIAALSCNVLDEGSGGNDSLEKDFDKIVEDSKTLGVDLLRIGMLPWSLMDTKENALKFCRMANDYAEKLKDHGINLYYHNHHVELRKYDGVALLDLIAEEAPLLGFELDVHWLQRGGANPSKIIEKYAGKVELIHLKDYRVGEMPKEVFAELDGGDFKKFYAAFTNIIEFAELGTGNLDFKEIIETSLEAGVRYLLIEQDMLYGRDVYEALEISKDHLLDIGYKELF